MVVCCNSDALFAGLLAGGVTYMYRGEKLLLRGIAQGPSSRVIASGGAALWLSKDLGRRLDLTNAWLVYDVVRVMQNG